MKEYNIEKLENLSITDLINLLNYEKERDINNDFALNTYRKLDINDKVVYRNIQIFEEYKLIIQRNINKINNLIQQKLI